jgi:hypothetical protein
MLISLHDSTSLFKYISVGFLVVLDIVSVVLPTSFALFALLNRHILGALRSCAVDLEHVKHLVSLVINYM